MTQNQDTAGEGYGRRSCEGIWAVDWTEMTEEEFILANGPVYPAGACYHCGVTPLPDGGCLCR